MKNVGIGFQQVYLVLQKLTCSRLYPERFVVVLLCLSIEPFYVWFFFSVLTGNTPLSAFLQFLFLVVVSADGFLVLS